MGSDSFSLTRRHARQLKRCWQPHMGTVEPMTACCDSAVPSADFRPSGLGPVHLGPFPKSRNSELTCQDRRSGQRDLTCRKASQPWPGINLPSRNRACRMLHKDDQGGGDQELVLTPRCSMALTEYRECSIRLRVPLTAPTVHCKRPREDQGGPPKRSFGSNVVPGNHRTSPCCCKQSQCCK